MKTWAKQGFLNSATSNDDGWFKFSIRPYHKKPGKRFGMGIEFIISDCSNKIYLEMAPDILSVNEDGSIDSKYDAIEKTLQSIKERRKKIRTFAGAVAKAAEVIEANLDDYERQIMESLNGKA